MTKQAHTQGSSPERARREGPLGHRRWRPEASGRAVGWRPGEGVEVVVVGGWGWEGAASTASVLNVQLRSRPDGRHWPSGHRLSSGQFLRPVSSREVFCWRPRQTGAVW